MKWHIQSPPALSIMEKSSSRTCRTKKDQHAIRSVFYTKLIQAFSSCLPRQIHLVELISRSLHTIQPHLPRRFESLKKSLTSHVNRVIICKWRNESFVSSCWGYLRKLLENNASAREWALIILGNTRKRWSKRLLWCLDKEDLGQFNWLSCFNLKESRGSLWWDGSVNVSTQHMYKSEREHCESRGDGQFEGYRSSALHVE